MAEARLPVRALGRFGLLPLIIASSVTVLSGEDVLRNSSRECAICHIRWVEAFDKSVAEDAQMQTILERQAGSGDMCLSCHDGSVTDSRFKVWSTRNHTTGSVPSPEIKIPTDQFPLDADGKMTCATCHTAHAVPDSSDIRTVVFLRQPNIDSSLCLACHGEHAHKNARQHPLGRRDTPVPQVILDAGGKTSEDGHMVFCQTCHEPHGARNAWMLVLPPSELCIACHTDKAPETIPAASAPVHSIGQTYPGFEPPASLLSENATFGTNGELDCLSCHRLHDASGAWPLLIQKNEDSSLCLECHKKEEPVLGSPHDLRLSSPETVNAGGKKASESGPCGSCHRIHGWARDVTETGRPHSSGCMECHKTSGPGSRNRPYVDSHPVGVPLSEGMSTDFPLDSKTGNIGCLTCHDPHLPLSSQVGAEKIESTASSKSKGEGVGPDAAFDIQEPRSFLRAKGSVLCSHCHDKVIDSRTPHDPMKFSPEIRQELAVHPSIGSCRVCHATHNAHGPRLWARTPLRAEDESVSNLCGTCHENKQGIQGSVHDASVGDWAEKVGFVSKDVCVDCHPIHAPSGQDGIWSHVPGGKDRKCETCHDVDAPGKAVRTPHLEENIERADEGMPVGQDGKVRCSTCHDIHRDVQEAMLLRSQRSDSSLCVSCHAEQKELLGTAHDMRTFGPQARNMRDETAVESGPCGSCHAVHHFGEEDEGRVEGLMSGADFGRAMCVGCHSKGGIAEKRVPKHLDHPEIRLMNRTDPNEQDYMPTFDEHGEADKMGVISCLTCHEFHPAATTSGTGQGATALRGRFLRPLARQSLCADCHGEETLWRFLYYHKDYRNPNERGKPAK